MTQKEVWVIVNDTFFLTNTGCFVSKNPVIEKELNTISNYLPRFKIGMIVTTKCDGKTKYGVIANVHCGYEVGRKENCRSIYGIVFINQDGYPTRYSAWHDEDDLDIACDTLEYGYKLLSYYERSKHNNQRGEV